MALTRAQKLAAFTHVTTIVFDMEDTDPLPIALEEAGLKGIGDLISMSEAALSVLTYNNGTIDVPVPRHDKSFVRLIQAYNAHRVAAGNPIGDDWLGDEIGLPSVSRVWRCTGSCSASVAPPSPRTCRCSDKRCRDKELR